MPILNKDMQVCISLSGRPSNLGTRFHNFLYDESVLDAESRPPSFTIRAARASGTPVITGAEVIALQAARQFERYTGVALTRDQVDRASAFSRAE